MKFPLILLGLLLSLDASFAQNCEEKVTYYGGDFDFTELNRVIRTADGHFVLAGQKNADVLVIKADECGNIVWEKSYTFGSEAAFRDIIQVGTKFIGVGYCTDCRANDSGRKILVHELNANGDLMGAPKFLGPTNLDADAFRIRPISGNRVIIAGMRTITQGNVSGTAMSAYILDASLNTVGSQFFGLKALQETAYDVVEYTGGGFLFTGASGQATNPVLSQIRVLYASANLTEIWSQEYFPTNSLKVQAGRAVALLPNGDPVIAGSRLIGNNTQLFVARLNPLNGQIKQQADFGGAGDDFARDLVIVSADTVLVGGLRDQPGISENPWALVLDGLFNVQREYQVPGQGLFTSVLHYKAAGKSNYVFSGTALGFPARGLLARTTSDPTTSLEGPLTPHASEALRLFPNPSRGQVQLEGWTFPADARMLLTAADGRVVFTTPARYALELPALPAGRYTLEIVWDQGRVVRPLLLTP